MKNSVQTFLIIALFLFTAMFIGTVLKYENTVDTLIETIDTDTQNCANTLDSLFSVVDSLTLRIDTLEYESIDTTIVYWPWGREEFYYYKYKIKDLLDAIINVESSDNDSAYHSGEDAVGCLQIRQCMVNDVNRILKRQGIDKRFTYFDRWNRNKSIEMFNIYVDYYNLTTAEEIARCWNGGPRGANNLNTVGYWNKVKSELDEIDS
jgi:hypothetical protein